MNRGKGSQFERAICKRLSRWWTEGERDDIFWRTSQSGGRATERTKKSLKTFGSYGDVMAVDPVGQPLTRMFTIELKRGDSHGHPLDLLDARPTDTQRKWEKALNQTFNSYVEAGSAGWLLIHRRDHREAIAYIDWRMAKEFNLFKICSTFVVFKVEVNTVEGKKWTLYYGCLPLEDFLRVMKPQEIINKVKKYL